MPNRKWNKNPVLCVYYKSVIRRKSDTFRQKEISQKRRRKIWVILMYIEILALRRFKNVHKDLKPLKKKTFDEVFNVG